MTTASLRRNTKQNIGRNTVTATPGTIAEVQTKQRATTAEPQRGETGPSARRSDSPGAPTRGQGCLAWGPGEGRAARPAAPEASPRRGTEANRLCAPTAKYI